MFLGCCVYTMYAHVNYEQYICATHVYYGTYTRR